MPHIWHLLREMEDKDWEVISPSGGFSETIDAYLRREFHYMEVEIQLGDNTAIVRLIPVPESIEAEAFQPAIIKIEEVSVFFLDSHGQPVTPPYRGWMTLNTEITTGGVPAGKLRMWRYAYTA